MNPRNAVSSTVLKWLGTLVAGGLSDNPPVWMKEADYLRRKEAAERVIKRINDERVNNVIFAGLQKILNGVPVIVESLENLDPEWREKLVVLDTRIREASEKNAVQSGKNLKESEEIARLKPQILKQLEILQKLFSDPSVLERIESYDNPFAPGNLETLKKVAQLLHQNQESKEVRR